jgi:hypothetical protein
MPMASLVMPPASGDDRNAASVPTSSDCSTPNWRSLDVYGLDIAGRPAFAFRPFGVEFVDVRRLDDARMDNVDALVCQTVRDGPSDSDATTRNEGGPPD